MQRVFLGTLVLAISLFSMAGCGSKSDSEPQAAKISGDGPAAGKPDSGDAADSGKAAEAKSNDAAKQALLHPEVVIETSAGNIKVRLDMEKARMTSENFLRNYVERGFYQGTVFHHVENGFMIIGGGYTAEGLVKETRTPIHNESYNGLKNRRGTIAMARDAAYADSATSQFFINLADNPSLDYSEQDGKPQFGYCVFGEVVEGMDVVDRIAQTPVKASGNFPKMPTEPVTIRAVVRR
jgi:peptidyl-prolyl cis-trans isomerase A (cyclophilin A)